jgi:Protein of unknown function (DUF2442)
MNKIPRIAAAEIIIHGVLKIEWNDSYVGVVDLRPVIARGDMFDHLKTPAHFNEFTIGEHGHALVWRNTAGVEIDFGSGSLRKRAETQTELHHLPA